RLSLLHLASRAEPRAATACTRLRDRRAAAIARLALASVDLELVLHRSRPAVGTRIVTQRRTLPSNPRAERLLDRACEPFDVVVVERSCRRVRMDARAPEGLVYIDVPHPRERALVEERGLDRCASAREPLAEPRRSER